MSTALNPSVELVSDLKAAEILSVSRSKVWSLIRSGKLEKVMLPPRTTRITVASINRLIKGA